MPSVCIRSKKEAAGGDILPLQQGVPINITSYPSGIVSNGRSLGLWFSRISFSACFLSLQYSNGYGCHGYITHKVPPVIRRITFATLKVFPVLEKQAISIFTPFLAFAPVSTAAEITPLSIRLHITGYQYRFVPAIPSRLQAYGHRRSKKLPVLPGFPQQGPA